MTPSPKYHQQNLGDRSGSKVERRVGSVDMFSFFEKGMVAYSKNEMEKAREYFKKALYFRPNKIEAQRALDRVR